MIELSYGYHTPLAMQISQNLTASKHYDLVARIPIHNSYGQGYYWLWSKYAGEPKSAKTYDLMGRISSLNAYGNSDFWVWRKRVASRATPP